jgi:hypothetical protein
VQAIHTRAFGATHTRSLTHTLKVLKRKSSGIVQARAPPFTIMLVGSAQRCSASREQHNLSAQASRCRHALSVLEGQHVPCAPDVNLAFVRIGGNAVLKGKVYISN